MNGADLSRFDDLVSRHLDGPLSEEEAAALSTLLADPALASRFLDIARIDSEIRGLLAAPVPDAAMAELVREDIEQHLVEPIPVLPATPRRSRNPLFTLRRLAWAAVFVVIAGLAALFVFRSTPSVNAPIVASVQGEVRLDGPLGERSATHGLRCQPGERLRTIGRNSSARIEFRDGSSLRMNGNVSAIYESRGAAHRLRLDHGTIQATLKPHPKRAELTLATPDAEVVATESTFLLEAAAHSTRLEVTAGAARFRRRVGGEEIWVEAGHYAVCAENAPFVSMPSGAELRHH
jgi:ferric-dicitrate binding protein FerR (iron transport regulator)